MKLEANVVMNLGKECMFDDEYLKTCEDNTPPKELWADGQGLVRHIVFDKRKIKKHKGLIKELLNELPLSFFTPNGDSFLRMPFDKDDCQWGEQTNAEMLFCLGVAADYIWFLPRPLWVACPGRVPILGVDFNLTANRKKHLKEYEKNKKKKGE